MNSILRFVLIATAIWALMLGISFGQNNALSQSDTTLVELDKKIVVHGVCLSRSEVSFPTDKTMFPDLLKTDGFGIVKKGVFLAQDIYMSGFKRSDIELVIDGERYFCACPNRMDSPLSRTNSMEMESIWLNKTSAPLHSGLGGNVTFNRETPQDLLMARAGFTQSFGALQSSDFGFMLNSKSHRVSGRYAVGHGYDDANGVGFVENYNYKDDYSYYLIESAITGVYNEIYYRAELTYTEDIMFPYLLMDERDNTFLSTSIKYKDHKFYLNYTSHMMDNGLRKSNMSMITDATNLTIGLTGKNYEVYFRNWNSDNNIVTPMTSIENHLIPDVRKYHAIFYHSHSSALINMWGKFGVSRHEMPDSSTLDLFKTLYKDAVDSKTDIYFDFGGSVQYGLTDFVTAEFIADLSTQSPATEYMYIAVKKPTGKPWWIGNPTLKAPTRISFRSNLSFYNFSVEAFSTFVKNYVNPAGIQTIERNYRTYQNIDATMLGFDINGNWDYFNFTASYTWAKNYDNNEPLAEIPPFSLLSNLKFPEYKRFSGYFRHLYNDAQTRVDSLLNEASTGSWHQFDCGLRYSFGSYNISVNVLNLGNEQYYQHLSYQRNPYSSGMQVYEPGRVFMINFLANLGV